MYGGCLENLKNCDVNFKKGRKKNHLQIHKTILYRLVASMFLLF